MNLNSIMESNKANTIILGTLGGGMSYQTKKSILDAQRTSCKSISLYSAQRKPYYQGLNQVKHKDSHKDNHKTSHKSNHKV